MGAAWANTLSYATLAIVTIVFSQQAYPIPYEWSRLFRIVLAGAAGYAAASWAVPALLHPLAGLLLRGTIATAAYVSMLYVLRFFHAGEIRMLREIRSRISHGRTPAPEPDRTDVEMAGEIVAAAPEPALGLDVDDRTKPASISRDSRAPRR